MCLHTCPGPVGHDGTRVCEGNFPGETRAVNCWFWSVSALSGVVASYPVRPSPTPAPSPAGGQPSVALTLAEPVCPLRVLARGAGVCVGGGGVTTA